MKKVRTFLVGFLTAVILMGLALPAIAAGGTVTWDSVFVGVDVVIDGEKAEVKDESGSPVEAVLYKGTTYVPVQMMADALGLDLNWDQDSRTVYLGAVPEKPEPEPEPAGDEQYIGTYRLKSLMGFSVELLAAMSELEVDVLQEIFVIELKADGVGILRMEEDYGVVRWTVEGETLILSVEGESIEGTIKDGVITLVIDDTSIELAK
jgi:Copper amine oxidase N-terminal domain.